jgi:hypothetical protein
MVSPYSTSDTDFDAAICGTNAPAEDAGEDAGDSSPTDSDLGDEAADAAVDAPAGD